MNKPSPPRKLSLTYVCDFASVHARTYIDYFAARPHRYDVTVISTRAALSMPNVRLLTLLPLAGSERYRKGRLGALAYQLVVRMPKVYERLRLREDVARVQLNLHLIRSLAGALAPDLIHGFRTIPEGVLAMELRRLFPDVPFFLSTWGQDFVVWATHDPILGTWTRAVLRDLTALLADNRRDELLARTKLDLPPRAHSTIMPASGGLCVAHMETLRTSTVPVELPGTPTLFSMRGYQNIYVQVKVLLEALKIFLRDAPGAHLYIDGRAGHPGAQAVRRWIRRLGLMGRVTLVHLTRAQMFRYMEACDIYVSATLTDGLPISLLEALYFGQIPVVMRHDSTFPPLIHGVNAIGVDQMAPEAIAASWGAALRLLPGRAERTTSNRELLATAYDRDRNLARVEQVYSDAAGQTAGTSM